MRLGHAAAGVLIGNLSLHQLPVLPSSSSILGLLLISLLAARRAPVIVVAILSFAWTAWAAHRGLEARWPPQADGVDVGLVGWVDRLPAYDAGRAVLSLRVEAGDIERLPRRIRLSWYDPAPAISAGQTLEIEARLRSPRGLLNPGGFDYERWLFVESYDASGYVRSGRIDDSRRFGLGQSWLSFRAALVEQLDLLIEDSDARALVQALALGERIGFEERHWTTFRRTGTSHLVAVSGLHIGLIAALSYALLLRLWLRLPYRLARHAIAVAAASSLVPATIYAALAGFTLPTQRALIMLVAVQSLVVLRRRLPFGNGLLLALIVILVFDPLASLTASFWLSFGAVALLVAASAPVERPLASAQSRAGFGSSIRLQLALTLGLAPLVIWHFGQVSSIALIVNLIAIPLFGFVVVPLSLLTIPAVILGAGEEVLTSLAGSVARLAWLGLDWAARPELAAASWPRPPLPVMLLALAGIAMSLTRHRLPGRRLALLALLPLGIDHRDAPEPGHARVTVLDVGHGLAVAIDTAGHRILYDAGPLFRSGFDAGAEIVTPSLRALGAEPLDLLILSHGDSDHAGGAAAVVAAYPEVEIVAGPDASGFEAEPCADGESWTVDEVVFRALYPDPGFPLVGNDSSCVVRIETRAGVLLLTGDIESRAEAILSGQGQALDADVVIVPHHGSATSSTRAFVEAVSPSLAIVSAAHNNRWNFPRPEVTERWNQVGAKVLVTGDQGAIRVDLGPDGIRLVTMRQARHRYWRAERPPVSGAADVSAL